MQERNATVGTYNDHAAAAEAVKKLNENGFPMTKVSIIGKELQRIEDVEGYYTWKDPAKMGAGIGGFWGSIFGIMVGIGFIAMPGVGGVFVAGSLAATLLAGVEGAALGSIGGGLFGALLGMGIGKEKVLKYHQSLQAGKYLVVAHGSEEEVKKAQEILGASDIGDVEVHT